MPACMKTTVWTKPRKGARSIRLARGRGIASGQAESGPQETLHWADGTRAEETGETAGGSGQGDRGNKNKNQQVL